MSWSQVGAKFSGTKAPPRNAIGRITRLAMEVAACWDFATAPTSRPMERNAAVPQATIGMAIHHDAVSFSPKYGVVAMARNPASWTMAITRLTPILAPTTDAVLAGASRSRRSSLFSRQFTSVIAAPKVAPDAMAQPSRPGARYWIAFSDLSSTCCAASRKAAGRPVARWLACCTIDEKTVFTTPAVARGLVKQADLAHLDDGDLRRGGTLVDGTEQHEEKHRDQDREDHRAAIPDEPEEHRAGQAAECVRSHRRSCCGMAACFLVMRGTRAR